ncbi:N-acetyl-gamma-glutamyl-phosphate reductase [uncultured Litoreibacter sp.]|uniref:N-acetyl-gamma-glutamyl-phosphate reductase n=1 Tax=uncultured Litoreibacter sp. TaxID=1392394 RepID=UPI002620B4B4|nr:N-acetyl-gamma-glutamyl-phosphate reductase [uncultured Litoreibacter sp.]
MTHRVFIDGEVGTTGLKIRERLIRRSDIKLISLDEGDRKSIDARLAAYEDADVGILCLPDDEATKVVSYLDGTDVRLIDASSAHRTKDDWVFGFPELEEDRRARIGSARFVSNPGCYATGAIALLYPLAKSGIIDTSIRLSINAVSGYSGGGKAMIHRFENNAHSEFLAYGLSQRHKHIPEIMKYSGLEQRPIFNPAVAQFERGMIVQIPLINVASDRMKNVQTTLEDQFAGSHFISVVDPSSYSDTIDPQRLNGTNNLEISIHGDADSGGVILIALLDNLGKGASGAAVQNLNIMLGIKESEGL